MRLVSEDRRVGIAALVQCRVFRVALLRQVPRGEGDDGDMRFCKSPPQRKASSWVSGVV